MDIQEVEWGGGLDGSGSEWKRVAGCGEWDNACLDSVK